MIFVEFEFVYCLTYVLNINAAQVLFVLSDVCLHFFHVLVVVFLFKKYSQLLQFYIFLNCFKTEQEYFLNQPIHHHEISR